MKIRTCEFIAGIATDTKELESPFLSSDIPKIAFIGRSNVGKSSLINALTNSSIARASSLPGSTQQINLFLINGTYHLVDLPGYGFARGSLGGRFAINNLIDNYLLNPKFSQKKVVLIIDASVGMTDRDESMFHELRKLQKDVVIAASKIDKMTQSDRHHKIAALQEMAGDYPVFPISSTEKSGIDALRDALFE
jgi:GTP-binding protein